MNSVLYSSKSDEWETPQHIYDQLNEEFCFNLDPCATKENAKCADYFTAEDDGLKISWRGRRVFCNPPYSKIRAWVEKCYEESVKGALVVMLIPARTDTQWFHGYIYNRSEIRFIKGRIKFGKAKYNAPFPSMVVIFRPAENI